MAQPKRPIRIAGASGAASDRSNHSLPTFARNHPSEPIDVIIADYLSEANMVVSAARKAEQDAATAAAKAKENSDEVANGDPISAAFGAPAYEAYFLEGLEPALEDVARFGIRVVVNAGGSDTEGLYRAVMEMLRKKGLDLEVAWISGDSVLSTVQSSLKQGISDFKNIYTSETLATWSRSHTPISAQAYLGGLGIAAALQAGAQIVLCGRVSDASPVIGSAYWWHNWVRNDLDKLANALIAGHLIECSNYVCGGNFTGFKDLENSNSSEKWPGIGYPIAEIASDGSIVVTKQKGTGGFVTVETCTAQLLYEIQGRLYHNSDVTADLSSASFTQVAPDRVALRGIRGLPPPPTTKCFLTAVGGHQAEATYYLTGLDVEAKARMLRSQLVRALSPFSKRFTTLEFSVLGSPLPNSPSQNAATVPFRIFAQAPKAEDLSPEKFVRPILNNIMQGYPGATFHLDFRLGFPRPYFDAFVTRMQQADLRHVVHVPGRKIEREIPPPPRTRVHDQDHDSSSIKFKIEDNDDSDSVSKISVAIGNRWGPTQPVPLGRLVHARSGDKGPDCNVGFFLPSPSPSTSAIDADADAEESFAFLRTLLTTPKIVELLGDEAARLRLSKTTRPRPIQRDVFPGLRAVHFLLPNILGGSAEKNEGGGGGGGGGGGEGKGSGVTSTTSVDFLGKNVAEFLRGREVDVPVRFLEGKGRGRGSKL